MLLKDIKDYQKNLYYSLLGIAIDFQTNTKDLREKIKELPTFEKSLRILLENAKKDEETLESNYKNLQLKNYYLVTKLNYTKSVIKIEDIPTKKIKLS